MSATIRRPMTPAQEVRAELRHIRSMIEYHREMLREARLAGHHAAAAKHGAEVIRFKYRAADAQRRMMAFGGQ